MSELRVLRGWTMELKEVPAPDIRVTGPPEPTAQARVTQPLLW